MHSHEVRRAFSRLRVWRRGSEQAPYKPLLLLWVLARYQQGAPRLVAYAELDGEVLPMFQRFAARRSAYHTEYPFWYLQNDGVWEVQSDECLAIRRGKASQPTKRSLLESKARGGFTRSLFGAVLADQQLLRGIVRDLLHKYFPRKQHRELIQYLGLDV